MNARAVRMASLMWVILAYTTFMLLFIASTRTVIGGVLLYGNMAALVFCGFVTVLLAAVSKLKPER